MRHLASQELDLLERLDWSRYAGYGRGILVRSEAQHLLLVSVPRVLREYPCSTARAGLGHERSSGRTPTGWHEIGAKIGDGLPPGAVLRQRRWDGEIWHPGDETGEDLILGRILRLSGLERGRNLGGEVDSWKRMIYIHGTNQEQLLGTPASAGCIRLSREDITDLYDRVEVGHRVVVVPGG